jgi:hypothetical protein
MFAWSRRAAQGVGCELLLGAIAETGPMSLKATLPGE